MSNLGNIIQINILYNRWKKVKFDTILCVKQFNLQRSNDGINFNKMIIMLFGIACDKLCQHGQREGSDAVKGQHLKRESIEEVHKNVSVY